MNNEYRAAIAFLQFKRSYEELATACVALPDLDVSDNYPFYLLDFEVIAPAVSAWCNIMASNLLREIPDRIDNPACLECRKFKVGIGADGLCKGAAEMKCGQYPFIVYTKEQVLPVLLKYGTKIPDGASEKDVHLLYLRFLEVKYDEGKQTEETLQQEDDVSGEDVIVMPDGSIVTG